MSDMDKLRDKLRIRWATETCKNLFQEEFEDYKHQIPILGKVPWDAAWDAGVKAERERSKDDVDSNEATVNYAVKNR